MCPLHHSEEAESFFTHEAEESTGSDARGTQHMPHVSFDFFFLIAFIWSFTEIFFLAGKAESGCIAPTASESSL